MTIRRILAARVWTGLLVLALLAGCPAAAFADAIENHPGDVFLRLDDQDGSTTRIYRFDVPAPGAIPPAFTENQGVIWSPTSHTEGLSVDKFEHIFTVEDAQVGAWGAPNPAIGTNQVMVIANGTRTVLTLGADATGFIRSQPGYNYVPAPETVLTRVGTSTRGRGCGSTFYPSPRVANIFAGTSSANTIDGPGTSDVVVGLNHWFLSPYRSQTAHGQWGNTAVRHKNPQMQEEHRQILGWAWSEDAAIFPIPSGQNPVGNPIITGISTKTDRDLFASCGDRCLVGADNIPGTPQHAGVPTKFMFSSDGARPQDQKMYTIQGVGAATVVQRIALDNGGNWTYSAIPSARIFNVGAGGPVQTFGNAASLDGVTDPVADDFIYMSDAGPTEFAVSTRFWRNGGTCFTYNRTTGKITWVEDYPAHTSYRPQGEITVGTDVISITADGRGNVYFLKEALDPPNRTTGGAGIAGTPDFYSLVDPNNPSASRYTARVFADDPPPVPDVGARWTRQIRVRQYPVYRLRGYNYVTTGFRAPVQDATVAGSFVERGTLAKGYFEYDIYATAPAGLPTTGSFSRTDTLLSPSAAASSTNAAASFSGAAVTGNSVSISGNRYFSSNNTALTTVANYVVNLAASVSVSNTTTRPISVPVSLAVQGQVRLSEMNPPETVTINRTFTQTVALSGSQTGVLVSFTDTVSGSVTREKPLAIGPPGQFTFPNPLPATPDPAGIQNNNFKVDAATINVTEPPPLPQPNGVVDIDLSGIQDPGRRVISEDTSPLIAAENPPEFSGEFTTDSFGQTNINYYPSPGIGDTDGDGTLGYFPSSSIQRTFKWRWTVKAVSEPLKFAYHQGRAATFNVNNDGVAFLGAWHDASGFAGDQPLPMRFNDTNPSLPQAIRDDKFKFADPGRFQITMEVDGTKWSSAGLTLTVFSTPNDIREIPLGSPGTTPMSKTEEVTVEASPKRPDQAHPIYDVAVFGPDTTTEDQVPATGNWYAQAMVQFFGANDYQYDTDLGGIPDPRWGHVQGGGANRMFKWDGVGMFDYHSRTAAAIEAADGHAELVRHRDGVAEYTVRTGDPIPFGGTRVDTISRQDWAAIGYTWYLKVRNPKFGAAGEPEFLPANTVAEPYGKAIRSGTLAELYDIKNAPAGRYNVPSLTNGVITDLLVQNPPGGGALTTAEGTRLFKITVPLTDAATTFNKLAFRVPTDPTRLRLTLQFTYPKVKWALDPAQNVVYYFLNDDGSGKAQYRYGAPANGVHPVPTNVEYPLLSTPDPASDICATDDFVETKVIDVTPPWVSGAGSDPTDSQSSRPTEFSSSANIFTGGVIRFDSAAHTLCVTVVDNNPYQHFLVANGTGTSADSLKWPKLSQFHYEVGGDPRTRDLSHGGVGLKAQGKAFGFAIQRTNDSDPSSSFNPQSSDFGGTDVKDAVGPILDPLGNTLPVPTDFVYPASRIQQWIMPSSTTPSFDYGVHFDVGTDGLPAFDPVNSRSEASIDLADWTRADARPAMHESKNYRMTVWRLEDNQLPGPIFLKQSPEVLEMGATAQDKAGNAPAQPRAVANYSVEDEDAPNLWIEIVEFKNGTPIYFVVTKDWARSFDSPGVDLDTAYMIFKASPDRRPIYRDALGAEIRNAGWPTSYSQTAETTQIVLGGTPQGLPGAPGMDVALEEDVRFRITVKAADNVAGPTHMQVQMTSINSTAQRPFPTVTKDPGPIVSGDPNLCVVSGDHFYARRGETDEIRITADDGHSNRREVVLHVTVTPHPTDYRVIGNSARQNR